MSFRLRVVKHRTNEEENKIPLYTVVMKVEDVLRQGVWAFTSEDSKIFDDFPLGQEFSLNALFEQQKIVQ